MKMYDEDKEEEKDDLSKLLMEEMIKMFAGSSTIAPSYARWHGFKCYVEVHKPEDFKWYSLDVASA